jgi:hypothetical protein
MTFEKTSSKDVYALRLRDHSDWTLFVTIEKTPEGRARSVTLKLGDNEFSMGYLYAKKLKEFFNEIID